MPTLQGFQILRSSAKLVASSFQGGSLGEGAVTMNSDVDFAVAAWHEGGTWNLEMLSDPYNLAAVIKELQNQQNNGGALALIAIDEEFFILVRVLGSHISLFISDVTCALDYEVANQFLDLADLPTPEEDDEPLPGGHMDIISDLGMGHMELEALCDDTELFPDEQLEAIAKRLGFSEEFVELLEL